MANKSSQSYVQNQIDNFILQQQRALANVVTQSIVNVSHKILQEQTANIITTANASNILNGYQIIVKNGAKFSINQQNYLKSTAEAILNLTQDSTLVLTLSNSIRNNIMSSLAQNADISNKLTAAATLLKEQQTSGEVNGVINAVSDLGSDVVNSVTSSTENERIINHVVQKYIMKQDAQTDLTTLINNKIKQDIDQITITNCINNSTLSNVINLKRIIIDGPNATFTLTQKNILDTFYKCVISSLTKSSDIQRLSNDIINTSSTSADAKAKVSNTALAALSDTNKSVSTSWLDSLTGMIGIIVVVVVICIIIILIKMSKSNKPPSNQGNQYNKNFQGEQGEQGYKDYQGEQGNEEYQGQPEKSSQRLSQGPNQLSRTSSQQSLRTSQKPTQLSSTSSQIPRQGKISRTSSQTSTKGSAKSTSKPIKIKKNKSTSKA